MITKLTVRGFRSFRDASVSFERLTILLGPNGAGKSNLAFALMTLSNLLHRPLNAEDGEQEFGGAGFDRLTYQLNPECVWEFRVEAENDGARGAFACRVGRHRGVLSVLGEALEYEDTDGKVEIDALDGTPRSAVAGINLFWPSREGTLPVVLRDAARATREVAAARWVAGQLPWAARFAPDSSALRSAKLTSRTNVQPSGRGFVAELRRLKDRAGSRFPAIVAKARQAMPFLDEIGFEVSGNDIELEATVRGVGSPLPAACLSDGFLLALFLAWATEVHDRGFLLLEDPDRSIHPYLHARIVDWVEGALRQKHELQVVLSTHSPAFVNTACAGHLERLRIVERSDGGGTTLRSLDPTSNSDLEQALRLYRDAPGTLWYSGTIGGVPEDVSGSSGDGEAGENPAPR